MGNCSAKDKFWTFQCCWPKNDDKSIHEGQPSSSNAHHIETMQNWEAKLSEASRDGKIVVANFSSSWCQPCKDIASTYSELANKYSSLLFLIVDVDKLAELCTSWDINATPTFYFLKDGRQVDKLVGANKSELQKKVAAMTDLATKSSN